MKTVKTINGDMPILFTIDEIKKMSPQDVRDNLDNVNYSMKIGYDGDFDKYHNLINPKIETLDDIRKLTPEQVAKSLDKCMLVMKESYIKK
jgi:hypothetical protein